MKGVGIFVQNPNTDAYLDDIVDGGLVPNPSAWTQAAWFIDPANATGKASDKNDGKTALTPVLSYNGGVVAKWGTTSPTLRQTTTLTWLSSQPVGNADPVVCTPLLVNAVLVIQGGAPTVLHAGVFPGGGVTPKNRAAAQLLVCDLGFAAPIGSIVQNMTPGKASRAFAYKLTGGTSFALTQPLGIGPLPPFDGTNEPQPEVDTWAAGDAFQVLAPVSVNLVLVQPTIAEFVAPAFPWPVQIYNLHIQTADGVTGNANAFLRGDVSLFEIASDALLTVDAPADDEGVLWTNVFANAGTEQETITTIGVIAAGAYITSPVVASQTITFQLSSDAIVDGSPVAGIGAIIGGAQGAFLQLVYLAGNVGLTGNCNAEGSTVWGPGAIDVLGTGRLFYTVGTAAATFLSTGALTVNGLANAWTFSAADPAVWRHLAAPITRANLDALAQYNGVAINPGGASISSYGGA